MLYFKLASGSSYTSAQYNCCKLSLNLTIVKLLIRPTNLDDCFNMLYGATSSILTNCVP